MRAYSYTKKMGNTLYINAVCEIRNQQVSINNKRIFEVSEAESMPVFLKALYKKLELNYPKYFKLDSLSKLGFLAAETLIRQEEAFSGFAPEEIGLVISNSSSSLDTDIKYNETIINPERYFPSPALFVYTLPNIMIGEIAIKHKITGENNFFISDKPDPDFLYYYINSLFETNQLKLCIAGWVEVFEDKYEALMFFVSKTKTKSGITEKCIFEPENLRALFVNNNY